MLSISSVYSDFSSIFGEILTEYSPSILGRVLSTIFGSIFDPFFATFSQQRLMRSGLGF
jgi:hypothetical protein